MAIVATSPGSTARTKIDRSNLTAVQRTGREGSEYLVDWNSLNRLNGSEFIECSEKRALRDLVYANGL